MSSRVVRMLRLPQVIGPTGFGKMKIYELHAEGRLSSTREDHDTFGRLRWRRKCRCGSPRASRGLAPRPLRREPNARRPDTTRNADP
jgi:hypothetical protein